VLFVIDSWNYGVRRMVEAGDEAVRVQRIDEEIRYDSMIQLAPPCLAGLRYFPRILEVVVPMQKISEQVGNKREFPSRYVKTVFFRTVPRPHYIVLKEIISVTDEPKGSEISRPIFSSDASLWDSSTSIIFYSNVISFGR
jgi:hypothetical protein